MASTVGHYCGLETQNAGQSSTDRRMELDLVSFAMQGL